MMILDMRYIILINNVAFGRLATDTRPQLMTSIEIGVAIIADAPLPLPERVLAARGNGRTSANVAVSFRNPCGRTPVQTMINGKNIPFRSPGEPGIESSFRSPTASRRSCSLPAPGTAKTQASPGTAHRCQYCQQAD